MLSSVIHSKGTASPAEQLSACRDNVHRNTTTKSHRVRVGSEDDFGLGSHKDYVQARSGLQ